MATQAPKKFAPKIIKNVTLPVIKLPADGRPRYLWIKGPMHLGKKIEDGKEAATVAEAVDCEDGTLGVIVCSMIMRNELNDQYPKDAYVGKFFEVILTRVKEKDYNIVSLTEIADPREDLASIAQKQAAGTIAKD